MHAIALKPQASLAPSNPWSVVPPLGDLQAYIRAVQALPLLSAEEERDCAERLRKENDLQAASRLVLSHLRVVVAIARQYAGYGLAQSDLIQEGNVGLMKAVRRYDPSHGTRLVTYAMHWIKAEIHEFILRNWRMVKVATTKAQRKLFFNLRSLKSQIQAQEVMAGEDARDTLTPHQVNQVAQTLKVKPEEVIEMESRLVGGDVVLDPLPSDDQDEAPHLMLQLSDASLEPTTVLEAQQREAMSSDGVPWAMSQLDARSRRIIEERWLKVNDNGTGGMTLHELAAEFGVSAERIRQIEASALKKMRKSLSEA